MSVSVARVWAFVRCTGKIIAYANMKIITYHLKDNLFRKKMQQNLHCYLLFFIFFLEQTIYVSVTYCFISFSPYNSIVIISRPVGL